MPSQKHYTLDEKIQSGYTLTSTYSLANNSLRNFEDKLGGATSNVDTYTFHTVMDFVRELNINIAAAPDAIAFGVISNTQSVQRNIVITLNGPRQNLPLRLIIFSADDLHGQKLLF